MTSDRRAWEAGTWEGSRRAQLRRSLALSVRERLEVLEALTETSAAIARAGGVRDHADEGSAASDTTRSDGS